MSLAQVCFDNAVKILATERRSSQRVNAAYRILQKNNIEAGVVDWLSNPFIRTALSILQSMSGSYKVKEAIRLLKEAGTEAEDEQKKKKSPASKKKW
jgi:arsenate reductase-like glutaredoxin family protein